MARIITTIGTSAGGLTAADVLTIVRANVGYEYIKFVPVTGTVSLIDITNLDTTTYSSFRMICTELNQGGSGAQNGYFQVGYGNAVNSTGNRYNNSWFAMPQTTSVSYGGNGSSQNYWFASSFGDGGSGYTWNPQIDFTVTPGRASSDAQIWVTVNGGTYQFNGNLAGSHSPSGGTNLNMLRIYGGNNITGSASLNSGVHVFGVRKRSS